MGEFDLIGRYFRPLASVSASASALSQDLRDDAAHIPLAAIKGDLVVTHDTLVSGIHFLATDPPETLGRKALRVNLSDLAAKGATPLGFLLSLSLPLGCPESFVAAFARGLAVDIEAFDVSLLGGDTTSTPGPLTLGVTALGTVSRPALLRSAGQDGHLLCVSGDIGWGALGLEAALGGHADRAKALGHYQLPAPQMKLGKAMLGTHGVGASMDISDGLLADARHLAKASGLKAEIELTKIPLADKTAEGQAVIEQITGGDDYQLLFSCDKQALECLKRDFPDIKRIGRLTKGKGLVLLDEAHHPLQIDQEGYVHGAIPRKPS